MKKKHCEHLHSALFRTVLSFEIFFIPVSSLFIFFLVLEELSYMNFRVYNLF